MSPPDQVLELVFSFLLEEGEKTKEDPQRTLLPACQLLQTRRMHGFDHVRLEVCQRGLRWALKSRREFWHLAVRVIKMRLANPIFNRPLGPQNRPLEHFLAPFDDPDYVFADPEVVRYL